MRVKTENRRESKAAGEIRNKRLVKMYQGETECWCELLLLLLLQAAGKAVGGFECEVSMEPEQSHLD